MGRFFSVSQINNYDPTTAFGCPRKWYYKSVLKVPEGEQSERALAGQADHKEIETYLRGGALPKSGRVKIGFSFLPDPGPDLLLEKKFTVDFGEVGHITGFIDCFHKRPTWVNEDREEVSLESVAGGEVIDWKTIDNPRAIKEPHELLADRQMLIYSWVLMLRSSASHMRVSQVFFLPSETKKKSVLVPRERANEAWDKAQSVAKEMLQIAGMQEDEVPVQIEHCQMGKWQCPYFERCSRRMKTPTLNETPLRSSKEEDDLAEIVRRSEQRLDRAIDSLMGRSVEPPPPAVELPTPMVKPPAKRVGKHGSELVLFVGCLPVGTWKAASLDLYVEGLMRKLSPDKDLRLVPGWEGILAQEIRSNPPAPGMYTVLFMDSLNAVLVNTLRVQATAVVMNTQLQLK